MPKTAKKRDVPPKTRSRPLKKKFARLSFKPGKEAKPPANVDQASSIYWPDRLDYVKAVAAQGLSDTEMAQFLGISDKKLDAWKAYYPLFNEAIENGRSQADVEVIQALHKNAIGYEYETDVVVRGRKGAMVLKATKFVPGDTNAQKFWLINRSANWRHGNNMQLGGQKGGKAADAIQIDSETKMMVIHSILNMITPRPDGDGKAPKLIQQNK